MTLKKFIFHNDFDLWSRIIESNRDIDVFFHPAYSKVFELNNDGKLQVLIYYESDNCFLIFPYFLRNIPDSEYFDAITPYGYGGFYSRRINDELFEAIQGYLTSYFSENNIISLFIRFHLFEGNVSSFKDNIRNPNDILIIDTGNPIDHIYRNYDRSVRKNMNKALKGNVYVRIDKEKKSLSDFYNIYIDTMHRNNAKKFYFFPLEFFTNLVTLLPDNTILFNSYINDTVVSTELVLYSSKYAYSFLGGSLAEFFELRVNDILKHEIISWCCQNHIQKFILGGGYYKNDGIFSYKQKFTNLPPLKFYVGEKIFSNQVYNELSLKHFKELNLQTEMINKVDFFPKYRYVI